MLVIPKTIHYCWFGCGQKSKRMQKCFASWKKFCPDFKIIEWNENNFDLTQSPYLLSRYERKQWAFLSDYARLLIIEENGGLYLDTDVEVVRPLDELLQFDAFFGFERNEYINTGQGFGAVAGHPAVRAMASVYETLVPEPFGNYPIVACPAFNTQALVPHGLKRDGSRQTVLGAEILPQEYLCPYNDETGKLSLTKHTYSVHWYGKSWFRKRDLIRNRVTRPLHRFFGTDFILFKLMRKMRNR